MPHDIFWRGESTFRFLPSFGTEIGKNGEKKNKANHKNDCPYFLLQTPTKFSPAHEIADKNGMNHDGSQTMPLGALTLDDRRRHFRLATRLPLDIRICPVTERRVRRVSANVSAGGVYFQGPSEDGLRPGHKIDLRIVVPPDVGRIAREGALEGQATVLRVEPAGDGEGDPNRVGVACVFDRPLRFIGI